MNILIFGASGATGHKLVEQALAQGQTVTAFVRDPAKLTIKHNNLKLVHGDVKDFVSVEKAIRGQDVVFSALGVSVPLKRDPVVVAGVKNIVKAMEQHNVQRFIYLSFLGVSASRSDTGFLMKNLISRIVRHEIADHEEKEALILSSPLHWTIVRAPKLTDGPRKGIYRSGDAIKPAGLIPTLSRADVADFMLKQLSDTAFTRKAVRVMY